MGKLKIDVCDLCDAVLTDSKSGIIIEGEHIAVCWAGRNSPEDDIFQGHGSHAPMDGRVSLTVCKTCLGNSLSFVEYFVDKPSQ